MLTYSLRSNGPYELMEGLPHRQSCRCAPRPPIVSSNPPEEPPTVQACRSLRFGGTAVPCGYEEAFQRALWTFKHQRVFCPVRQDLNRHYPPRP